MGLALYQFPSQDIISSSSSSPFTLSSSEGEGDSDLESACQDHQYHNLYYHPSVSGLHNPIDQCRSRRRRSRQPRNFNHEGLKEHESRHQRLTTRDGRTSISPSALGPEERKRRPPSLERQDAFWDARTVKRRGLGNRRGRKEYGTESTSSQNTEEEPEEEEYNAITRTDHLLSDWILGETITWTMIDDIAPIPGTGGIDSHRATLP